MKNFELYNERMRMAMKDKLFFIDHIPDLAKYDLVVDYGCGDGSLLRSLVSTIDFKNVRAVGFDISDTMIEAAKQSTHIDYNIVYRNINEIDNWAEYTRCYKKSIIIFSSVFHEMNENEQRRIIYSVMPYFTTVVVRDMKRPLNNEPISNITRKRILSKVAPWQAEMFESKWGKIRDKETMYRFFLMNEFVENFETEVEEDYFGVLWAEIEWNLSNDHVKVLGENFTLPYRKKQVKRVFSHVMNDNTHRKIIYTKGYNNVQECL